MRIRGSVSSIKEKTVDVLCDRCKASCKIEAYEGAGIWDFYYATIKVTGGYNSPLLPDGLRTKAHLCEACWPIARGTLEALGVVFIDTNYLDGDQPWAENDKRTEESNAAFRASKERDEA